MRRSGPTDRSPSRRLATSVAAVGALLAAALLLAACQGESTSQAKADAGRGKELFTQKCGQCHTLADAGTNGELGPNLDDAFRYAREQGFRKSTFFEIALEQMRIPAPPMPDFDDPDSNDRLSEEDLVDVANYVATCAGVGRKKPADCTGAPQGPQATFVSSCGGCHTLQAAGTNGQVGPNLDQAKPAMARAVRQITNGGGGMPAFKGKLTEKQIRALAGYVVKNAGRG